MDLPHSYLFRVSRIFIVYKVFTVCLQLRDLRHENVNPLVACFVDGPSPAIVLEFCNRGSLMVKLKSYTLNCIKIETSVIAMPV